MVEIVGASVSKVSEQKAPEPGLVCIHPRKAALPGCGCGGREERRGESSALLTRQLDVHVAIQQQILSLEVPVHDVMAVAVLHGRQNLPELLPCFILA